MKKFIISVIVFFIFVSTSLGFSDDNNFVWAKSAINKWSSKGYISGYPDGTFRGNNKITRAEVISIINKLNNSKITTNKRPSKDINYNDWFYNDMGKAASLGLISVDENGNLRPNEFATREEVMVILSKLLNITYSGNLDNAKVKSFLDSDKITYKNYNRVAGIVEEGFVSGYKDNTLRPKDNITRAEFMCVLNNAISEVISSGKYDNKPLIGNVVINGENVRLTNSEILGRVFVLDGAKDGLPTLINTKVSKGVNSRVGEILINNIDEFETLTEYNYNNPDEYDDAVFARLTYSEDKWTNKNVDIKVSFNKDEAKVIGNNKLTAKKNGEYVIEYVYNGKVRNIIAQVTNIDKKVPKFTISLVNETTTANVKVDVEDDGLSPIVEIGCGSFVNKINGEDGTINNIINVDKNGIYTVVVKDEAGNIAQSTIEVKDLLAGNLTDIPKKPIEEKGLITQSPDGIGGTGNGIVTDRILTFVGTIPYYTSSISDKRGNWIGAKIVAPSSLEIKNPKVYVDGVEVNCEFNTIDKSFLYYEKPVIGKTTELKVSWNEEYEEEVFYITISQNAVLENSTVKMVTINPNGGIWNNSDKVQSLNAGELEQIKIIDPKKETFKLKLDGNGGNIIGDSEFEINEFISWELTGKGNIQNGYYIFGDGEGVLTAKYLTEINLPDAQKPGYIHTGWFTSKELGEKVGNAGDKYVPTGAITLYAQFAEDVFGLEVKTTPSAAGSVLGVRDFYYDENVSLTAKPIEGYRFSNWDVIGITIEPDKLKEDTLTFKMPNNRVVVTANFVIIN